MRKGEKKKIESAVKAAVRSAEQQKVKPQSAQAAKAKLGHLVRRPEGGNAFRNALWQTYYPRMNQHMPTSVRSSMYDSVPTRWSDVTSFEMQNGASNGWWYVQPTVNTNVALLYGYALDGAGAIANAPVEVDRQVPDLANCHKFYIDTLHISVEAIAGNLSTGDGTIYVGRVPMNQTWAAQDAVVTTIQELNTYPGVQKFTIAEILAGKSPCATYSRIGPGADMSLTNVPMALAYSKSKIAELESREEKRRKSSLRPSRDYRSLPGLVGDNYQALEDLLVPFVAVDLPINSAKILITVTRAGEMIYRPDDNINEMPGVSQSHSVQMSDDGIRKLNQLTGHVPVVPNCDNVIDATKVIDNLSNIASGVINKGLDIAESPTTQRILGIASKLFGAVLL